MNPTGFAGALPAFILVLFSVPGGSTAQETRRNHEQDPAAGRLIAASTTMVSAWDIPRDPLADTALGNSPRADLVRRGYRMFMKTPLEAPRFTSNRLSCDNCHLNGGQRERALPLVGVAGVFPEFNKREGRPFSLEDRIVSCFMRSENATGGGDTASYPRPESEEVAAIAEYIRWLSDGISPGEKLPWRGQNTIHPDSLIPAGTLDTARGKTLFRENCAACHGEDGQGVQIGDKKAGPLWGPDSWNDGAGAARIYTLAGIIRHAMPYLNPGCLTDGESLQIAAYINSMPRPVYPLKHLDYRGGRIPPDAVYYRGAGEESRR